MSACPSAHLTIASARAMSGNEGKCVPAGRGPLHIARLSPQRSGPGTPRQDRAYSPVATCRIRKATPLRPIASIRLFSVLIIGLALLFGVLPGALASSATGRLRRERLCRCAHLAPPTVPRRRRRPPRPRRRSAPAERNTARPAPLLRRPAPESQGAFPP